MSFISTEDYQELIEDIVRDGRLYASENHQEILKVSSCLSTQEASMSSPHMASRHGLYGEQGQLHPSHEI